MLSLTAGFGRELAGVMDLGPVLLLGREDVLLHEGADALHVVLAARAGLEIHDRPRWKPSS